MMEYAKGRIAHIHLKDQCPENHRKYQTLGLGGVPNEKIVKAMDAAGYDGWYTLENAVSGSDTYTDCGPEVLAVYGKERKEPAAWRNATMIGMKPIHLRAHARLAWGLRFLSSGLVLKWRR